MTTRHKEVFLKDYTEPNFWMDSIEFEFDIFEDKVLVTAISHYKKNPNKALNDLQLVGTNMQLKSIAIGDKLLQSNEYKLHEECLILENLADEFYLKTVVEIDPFQNFSGEGLYKSGHILCTQCEAEGFRRITYALDRPDVMSKYKVKMIADKKQFPLLLANGNLIQSGELENDRHFVVWEDPYKKPSYLFAVVAGDLAKITDHYTTKSGRSVNLEIFVDHGNEDKTGHAMQSLKNAMQWDEETFGLEYDLDTYMIVAVDSFNMGAMENKGLNIFNSSYVLAKQETATDTDFQGIEGVIGHEYFHNWTGNRVTCRDWFQLTLKEGLTVFRDQEFSSDMQSRPVKRIEDVKILKEHQFPEDNGPLSHPIKPKSFVEINNFYTATVYEKGAEVIRMIHTLLGSAGFRKGMDLYFERHDGHAVTTEDFIQAMADANDYDLDQFKVWYDQNGTPKLNIEAEYNEKEQVLNVYYEQEVNTNNSQYDSLYFPFYVGLYNTEGESLLSADQRKLVIKDKKGKFTFTDIKSSPVLSLNENFTAPINIDYQYTQDDLATLVGHCQDPFNRYDAAQKLIELEIKNISQQLQAGTEYNVSDKFLHNYRLLLTDDKLDASFKAFALGIPRLRSFNDKLARYDFKYLPKAIEYLKSYLAKELYNELNDLVIHKVKRPEFSITAEAMGKRALKNYALDLLATSGMPSAFDLIYSKYQKADNMTDELGAMSALISTQNPYTEKALTMFYDKWKHETLVMQKWLAVQARSPLTNLDKMKELEQSDVYNKKIPNLLRSLWGQYARFNMLNFNQLDGDSYRYFVEQIKDVDSYNPQIAAGMAKLLNFKNKLDDERASVLEECLLSLKEDSKLSNDVLEVVNKNITAN